MYKSGNTENWKENRWQIKMQSQVENWDSIDFPKSPMTNAEGIKMDHMTEWRPQKKERRRTSGESEEFNSLTMVRMDKKRKRPETENRKTEKHLPDAILPFGQQSRGSDSALWLPTIYMLLYRHGHVTHSAYKSPVSSQRQPPKRVWISNWIETK